MIIYTWKVIFKVDFERSGKLCARESKGKFQAWERT